MSPCITNDRLLQKHAPIMPRPGQIRTTAAPADAGQAPVLSRGGRVVCSLAGMFFVALAGLGAVIPGLPTTPFLLLAAALFARSSPRLYQWLHHSAVFGKYLRDWKTYHAIPKHVRFVTVLMVAGGLAFTWLFSGIPVELRLINTVLCAVGLAVVFRLPVR